MFAEIRLKWRKAKALSVLQNAYGMPLREPLEPLTDTDLKLVTNAAYNTGGNAFDAAAGFMTLRIKSAYETNLRVGRSISRDEDDLPRLAAGLTKTRSMMNFYSLHMDTTSAILVLKNQVEQRDRTNAPPPADLPATS